MYKAKLKQGRRISDYLQTSSLTEVKERFNGRQLQPDETFELHWFMELIYYCSAGETIHIRDSKEAFLAVESVIAPETDSDTES